MRADVEEILLSQGIRYFELPLSARLLLVTDGTVTELLEALVREKIGIGFKKQAIAGIQTHPEIQEQHNISECLERAITLQGTRTGIHWLYAESVVYHQMLPAAARVELESDRIPIGTILRRHTSDNHRKITDCGYACNDKAASQLGSGPGDEFLYRSYQVLIAPPI